MSIADIAKNIHECNENIILIYAFNATGKTRLSVEYKDLTKSLNKGKHVGVYYNAFSEDLFYWDNDEKNQGFQKKMIIVPSNLNSLHSLLTEDAIKEKLFPYNPSYNFFFNSFRDTTDFESITFFKAGKEDVPIKISRGEERIFIWCFFLALFEVEGWADVQNQHIIIDDPVSSLDDHNIFITASSIFELVEQHFEKRKIIITTHHMGLFTILQDWLTKGEKAAKFRLEDKARTPKYRLCILESKENVVNLKSTKKGVMLYHLRLLQMLDDASKEPLSFFHFAMLRQTLEVISSFLGKPYFGYVLQQIGIADPDEVAKVINSHSHRKVYSYQSEVLHESDKAIFDDVLNKLKTKYNFALHN